MYFAICMPILLFNNTTGMSHLKTGNSLLSLSLYSTAPKKNVRNRIYGF